jgi:hypothetical protein
MTKRAHYEWPESVQGQGYRGHLGHDLVRIILVQLDALSCFRARRVARLWRRIVDEMTSLKPRWAQPAFARWCVDLSGFTWPPARLSKMTLAQVMGIQGADCSCGAPLYVSFCLACHAYPCQCLYKPVYSAGTCRQPFCAWLKGMAAKRQWCLCTWGSRWCGKSKHASDYLVLMPRTIGKETFSPPRPRAGGE